MQELPPGIRAARSGWMHTGNRRPPFAHEPSPEQESVWDYPRPPSVAPDSREVLIKTGDQTLALSRRVCPASGW